MYTFLCQLCEMRQEKPLKESAAPQKEFGGIKVKTYDGIWKDDITTADWFAKSGGNIYFDVEVVKQILGVK